jgi:hypothetical protein
MEVSSDFPERASVALFLVMRQFTRDGWQRKTVCRTTYKNSVVLYLNKVTQMRFRAHFQTRWAPSFKVINKFCKHFKNDGSLLARKCQRPSFVRCPEYIDPVRVALPISPSKSTKKAVTSTRDNQTIGATNPEKWSEFVSIQNNSVA